MFAGLKFGASRDDAEQAYRRSGNACMFDQACGWGVPSPCPGMNPLSSDT